MNKQLRNRIFIMLGVFLASIYFAFPIEKRINLGLDLKGGMHIILNVEVDKIDENARRDAVERAIEILRNRIDAGGVGETVIQRQGESQILVQLPGITDRDQAINMIGRVAQLEFTLVNDNPNLLKEALSGNVPEGYILKQTKKKKEALLVETQSQLKGEAIAEAMVDFNTAGYGEPRISFTLNAKGAKEFAKITRENTGRRLAIVLDGEVLSAPNIKEPILSGKGEITGDFSFEEASLLALCLRSGSLPAPMKIEEERTIGPLLGKDSINAGINATMIGGILVFIFMLIYYLKAGLISDIALILNLLLIVGTMGLLNVLLPDSQVTLTLPGIAGIILTLGMAVDANVLINERIREEMNIGQPLRAAINNGFNKAFKAIFDSNSTTLIAAFMLFQFGSGPIKGFAVTLSLGLLTSLYTALFVTKTLFLLFLNSSFLKKITMMSLFHETKIDFVTKRYICFTISIILIILGVVGLILKKDKAFGIDFAGGQIQEFRFEKPIEAEVLRKHMAAIGLDDVVIQQFNKNPEDVIIRTPLDTFDQVVSKQQLDQVTPDANALWIDLIENGYINEEGLLLAKFKNLHQPSDMNLLPIYNENQKEIYNTLNESPNVIIKMLKDKMSDNPFNVLRIEKVGPIVGKALRKAAIFAIVCALGGILIYVGFRFKHFDFATAGVIALLHDVILTLVILVMLGRQIDLLVVTALLTIAGYSINDTIIIYDRIRENLTKFRKKPLKDIINMSINQTLSRTVLTTITTLLVVVSLYLLGGEVLNTFALCLIIGFISGTYSTIFIASPLVLAWQKK